MKIIDPAMGWFEIVEVTMYDLDEVTGGNDEYIDMSYSRVIYLFNNTWLIRYPCPQKFVFCNGSEFKRYVSPLIKDFHIKPVLTTIKKPQTNSQVERVYQVILNMLVTKDLSKKIFHYIYP